MSLLLSKPAMVPQPTQSKMALGPYPQYDFDLLSCQLPSVTRPQLYWSPCCSLDSISPVQSPRLCSGCLLAVSLLQVSVEVNPIGQAFPSHPFQNGPSLPRTLLLLFILLNFNSTCYTYVCLAPCLSAPIGPPHPRAGWNFVLLTAGTSQEGSTQ